MKDPKSRPAIVGKVADMAQYDTVFVGFPIWWYQAPRIIETFLESYDFSGKTVIPFATSGGSGMGGEDVLRSACSKGTKWLPGKRLSSRESMASVQKWVREPGTSKKNADPSRTFKPSSGKKRAEWRVTKRLRCDETWCTKLILFSLCRTSLNCT